MFSGDDTHTDGTLDPGLYNTWANGQTMLGPLPERYEIRDNDEARYLHCKEAPGLGVSINRAYCVGETEARKLGNHIILLDGAGQFAPLLDDNQQLYNLDHHIGCLRAFTVATCEQALILVLKGLELDKGDWKIYANEPDLDTVFAIWVLLNHRRLRQLRPEARDVILPMLRLEGTIDANGFELAEYCGLPQAALTAARERIDHLHSRELEAKRSGDWGQMDLTAYTLEMLAEIDGMVYVPADFQDFTSIEKEFGHVEIGEGRVAVVCRDSSGIYEVERRLKKVWGDRLGLIALERQPNQYTLRRSAALAGIDLRQAYERLNLLDPNVDGRPPEKRWGGSDDIGGSPRPIGTALSPTQLVKILRNAYRPQSTLGHLQHLGMAALVSFVLLLAGGLVMFLGRQLLGSTHDPLELTKRTLLAGLVVLWGGLFLSREFSSRRLWLFGWRRSAGRDWLALVPFVLLGAGMGGAWLPPQLPAEGWPLLAGGGLLALLVLVQESLFRGLAHGIVLFDAEVQSVGGRWFVSGAVWSSALLYALATLVLWYFGFASVSAGVLAFGNPGVWGQAGVVGGSAFILGLALGMIRERSLSLWPGLVLHLLAVLARLGVDRVLA